MLRKAQYYSLIGTHQMKTNFKSSIMKALSYLFAFMGIYFLVAGIAFLTIIEPTASTEKYFFICFFSGMIFIVCFLIADKSTNLNN